MSGSAQPTTAGKASGEQDSIDLAKCLACGGKCCQVAIVQTTLANTAFLLSTRRCWSISGGVLLPARCRHLTEDNRCQVPSVRPAACRAWAVDGPLCRLVQEALR